MGSEIGSVAELLGKDDLRNARSEADLLEPGFLPRAAFGLEKGFALGTDQPGSLGSQGCPAMGFSI